MWFLSQKPGGKKFTFVFPCKRAYLFWIKSDYLISLETGHLAFLGLCLTSSSFVLICAFWPLNIMGLSRVRFAEARGCNCWSLKPSRDFHHQTLPQSTCLHACHRGNRRKGVSLLCVYQAAGYGVGFENTISWIQSCQILYLWEVACDEQIKGEQWVRNGTLCGQGW